MADSIFKVPKLKGSSNYDMWAIRIQSILIQQDCDDIAIIANLTPEERPESFKNNKTKSNKIVTARDVQILEGVFNDQAYDLESQLVIDQYNDQSDDQSNDQLNADPNTNQNLHPMVDQTKPVNQNDQKSTNQMKTVGRNPIVLIKNRARTTESALSTEVTTEDIILEEILFTSKDITDPKNYSQVLKHDNKDQYLLAMQKELDQLQKNNTWTLVPRPSNQPVLKGRWASAGGPVQGPGPMPNLAIDDEMLTPSDDGEETMDNPRQMVHSLRRQAEIHAR
ncbi:hypothetical protein COCHEDRAFT_1219378 [Bipolaris maydis C5]|uniref:DUF4219 domain-containing protein n=1 Tax=Cochliobolus heterostrophus (strain C5 / ATCC 48332 / race O) TaxID=701091 RepID=M2UBU2_COCH5|nr:hypothetical protein COCHEDRAFT_1219378 [Bipolaris maydis C5]